MNKSEEFFRLREEWKKTGNAALLDRSHALIESLTEEEKPAFFEAIHNDFKRIREDIADIRRTGTLRDLLEPVLPSISVASIAKGTYGKSAQWFYQRMNGNMVNGRPARFSDCEIARLAEALRRLAAQLNMTAELLDGERHSGA